MTISNTYRFFVGPETIQGEKVHITDQALVHQINRVLRLTPGDEILLLDGQGNAYTVVLRRLDRASIVGHVARCEPAGGEPTLALTLYVARMRSERFEWVLQKGTELGAGAFVPVQFAHSLPAERTDNRRQERWSRIVREAAEQSCRAIVPPVAQSLDFSAACAAAASADLACILWEGPASALRTVLRQADHPAIRTLSILSGPEGGITPEELTIAREHGIIPSSLGPRILRAETAPIAATAAIFYEMDW